MTDPPKSLADSLPPEIAQQLHPDGRKNEADYPSARDGLLTQYRGQWIGFADAGVLVSASTPLEVFCQRSNRESAPSWFASATKMSRGIAFDGGARPRHVVNRPVHAL